MILINNPGKSVLIISKMSRRDTIIVNCQLSIVNSAKPLNSNLSNKYESGMDIDKCMAP